MELPELSMLNVSLDFVDNGDFDFSPLSAGSSSGSTSGSSYASSSFGPHTPMSARSATPFSNSFDFSSSFASSADTMSFDLTPSSSATSSYFPMTPDADHVPDLVYPAFPITPSRAQFDFSGSQLATRSNSFAAPQPMDYGFYANPVGAHPFLSTPSAPTQFGHFSDTASHWMYSESPISFDQQSPSRLGSTAHRIKLEPEDDITAPPTPSTRRRALMGEVRHRTTALQAQVQQGSPPATRVPAKRPKRARVALAEGGSFAVENVERAGKFRCLMEGCPKVYRRSEHMKRHVTASHYGAYYPCVFCAHVANRHDNYMSHLKLHAEKRKSSGGGKPRVKYFPAAVLELEKEMRKAERGGKRSTKVKQERSC